MDNSTQTQTQAVTNGVTPFRINSIEQLPTLAQDESCHIIKQYFDYLEHTLSNQESVVDVDQLRAMLNEVSGFIRSNKSQLRADGYSRMLKRLNHIYSQGLRINNDRAFTRTAVNFADILNTVSQSFPSYDYSESVGLLLHYMHKMFNYREEGWIEVFEHLISMSDSLEIMQLIKTQHLQEIQNWVEEGVDNLFALMDEQLEVIDNIDAEILSLDQELLLRRKELSTETRCTESQLVIPISRARDKQLIQILFNQRAELITERVSKLELADLLDENIQEFTDRLIEIRRSAMIQLVWSNPALQ
ncbi:MAG: hypothetical protein JAY99_00270 [Candidatus Thiodiazotropha lotti]|uniref:Uncharacterized protein n=1 Tax=Candidatus Thiodiazotropha endoloripes TaxID=1818881 RepID=A0A1E2UP89_9GAMM|nr:hypothetical protein [Candidatus Thiodiazotropha endoloripes]MCG7897810.1 hypothetical protein [Candidatus Thiodiazotropha weberae]MCG7993540.1 hypothetical protein [Candidatus Thiodiazotropha lotti]MCG7901219.1 hypothetical protein [Candidatus Thiodiazotropha weberae]MCG7914435.1 hypothetical protein [Candidatus Thiodiazotropha weberae]MCG7997941.1 hypothetical protein [Candidatus Thiodiazotropha lotti]